MCNCLFALMITNNLLIKEVKTKIKYAVYFRKFNKKVIINNLRVVAVSCEPIYQAKWVQRASVGADRCNSAKNRFEVTRTSRYIDKLRFIIVNVLCNLCLD